MIEFEIGDIIYDLQGVPHLYLGLEENQDNISSVARDGKIIYDINLKGVEN